MAEGALPLGAELRAVRAMPGTQRAFDVPYAVVADMLLTSLAKPDEAVPVGEWAESVGLNFDSALVQELMYLALDLERQHPRGLLPEEREEVLQRFSGDDEGLKLWTQERLCKRYRAAGAALGRWLEARRTEGYPPEFLIERLLSRPASLIAQASKALPQAKQATLGGFQAEAEAFEKGMRTVMDTVPDRFRSDTVKH